MDIRIRINFITGDKWVGLSHKSSDPHNNGFMVTDWYLCVVPMLSIHWQTKKVYR